MIPLGMQSQDIPDSAITASSSHNLNSFAPYLGRLHLLSSGGKHGSWAAAANNINQWFQVDFGSWTRVRAISTQGRQDAAQGVKSFTVTYSYDVSSNRLSTTIAVCKRWGKKILNPQCDTTDVVLKLSTLQYFNHQFHNSFISALKIIVKS